MQPLTSLEWPFDEPQNLAVITTQSILRHGKPILLVGHDSEDGGWSFLDGDTFREEEAIVVSLRSITERDPSVMALADLPLGWEAWRENADSLWERSASPFLDDQSDNP